MTKPQRIGFSLLLSFGLGQLLYLTEALPFGVFLLIQSGVLYLLLEWWKWR